MHHRGSSHSGLRIRGAGGSAQSSLPGKTQKGLAHRSQVLMLSTGQVVSGGDTCGVGSGQNEGCGHRTVCQRKYPQLSPPMILTLNRGKEETQEKQKEPCSITPWQEGDWGMTSVRSTAWLRCTGPPRAAGATHTCPRAEQQAPLHS